MITVAMPSFNGSQYTYYNIFYTEITHILLSINCLDEVKLKDITNDWETMEITYLITSSSILGVILAMLSNIYY